MICEHDYEHLDNYSNDIVLLKCRNCGDESQFSRVYDDI